jgi:hypothetical protein
MVRLCDLRADENTVVWLAAPGILRWARRLKCDNRTRLFFGIAAFLPVISRAAAVILRILVSLIAP